eukprot:GSMAST32.ASY1.ANO1.2748.1 assembled CDS
MSTLIPLTLAAGTTATIMYPVDVVRALRMASAGGTETFSITKFIKTHGVRGLASQGAVAEIVKSSVMRVSKFFFFPLTCNGMFGASSKELAPWQKGLAGCAATIPEIFLITPLEGAKLGLQTDSTKRYSNSMTNIMKHVYQTRGLGGLWTGWAGLQLRNGLWTGTYFATLSSFKEVIEPGVVGVGLPQGVAQFTAGFCAGTFAAAFNTPADVIRTIVQRRMFNEITASMKGSSEVTVTRTGFSLGLGFPEHFRVFKEIIGKSGIKGVYPGFGFKAMHLGGSGALMAMFIPIFSRLLGIKYDI